MTTFVTNEATFLLALDFIAQNEVLTYDTETTGLNVRQDTIIGFGFSNSIDGFYVPLHTWDPNTATLCDISPSFTITLLQALAAKKLIMFNASFDCRITYSNFKIDLLPSLYCDAMLLKHTCDEDFPFGLKEIATKLWGKDAKAEKEAMQASIKANGGKATEYYKADTTLLGTYCVQDCLLTAKVFAHYSPILAQQGLQDFFYKDEVMAVYKELVIPMEMKGIRLDMNLLQSSLAEIQIDLVQLEASIQTQIAHLLPQVFTPWFLNKDYPLQTATGKQPLWAKKGLTQQGAFEADSPGQYMFNLQSKHHLKKLFFDTLGLEPLSKTPTGLPQVDEDFLESISPNIAWVADLVTFNKLNKLKSTYLEGLNDGQEDGIYYPSFAQHRTVSGRLAGNVQQFPRPVANDGSLIAKYTNLIRKLIIARPGHKLCSADYEQLEPSIFAHTSGDPALQEIFKSGRDFYSEVAIRTEGLEGVSSDKLAANYLGKLDKVARQKAKAYALGIAYGLTGFKLKFELGVSQNAADKLVQDYLQAFPQLAAWMQNNRNEAISTGMVRSQAGRVRHLRRAKQLYSKYGQKITDSLQLWKDYHSSPTEYAAVKKDYREYKNLLNNSINFSVQSLAASIMNRASVAVNRKLRQGGFKASIIASVHDEIVLDIPEDELDIVPALVKKEMETVVKLEVPLYTNPQCGNNFAECK